MNDLQTRSILEYCSPVWNSFLKVSDSIEIEKVHEHVLKTIYGHKHSYSDLCTKASLETLAKRRLALSLKFVNKEVKKPDSIF